MTYTEKQIHAANTSMERCLLLDDLASTLRLVLDSPKYNVLDNESKAGVLLELENEGEYDPENF